AGVLDRRTAGEAQRRLQLVGDDHRDRRLAEPGWARQQDVVGSPVTGDGGVEHERQLLADAILTDELVEGARAQRLLVGALVRLRRLSDDRLEVGFLVHRPRSIDRSASRSTVETSGSSPTVAATRSIAASASLVDQPRPTKASWTCVRHGAAPDGTARLGTAPTRSFSSSTMRSAPFLPMPGTLVSVAWSAEAIAVRRRSGVRTASIAWATLGPKPLAVCTSSNMSRSSGSEKP